MDTMGDYKIYTFAIFFPYEGGGMTLENQKAKNDVLVQIGRRLARVRTKKGYTQEQLANMTGLSMKMISTAENGYKAMRPENIIKICDCLSISTDFLLRGESSLLGDMVEREKINKLTSKQQEALSKIIFDFLSAFEE